MGTLVINGGGVGKRVGEGWGRGDGETPPSCTHVCSTAAPNNATTQVMLDEHDLRC